MRIVYYLRHWTWQKSHAGFSYAAMRTSAGFSGTDTCTLESAHILANTYGHEVILAMEGYTEDRTEDGIRYCNFNHINNDEFIRSIDVFKTYTQLDHNTTHTWNRMNPNALIVVWLQCIPMGHEMGSINSIASRRRIMLVAVSPWVENWVRNTHAHLGHSPHSLVQVNNAINMDFFASPQAALEQSRAGNFVYHAVFERGGGVAVRVARKFQQEYPDTPTKLHVASYEAHDFNKSKNHDIVQWHGSIGKQQIAELLRKSDYFVYPLVLDSGQVHHDTYACVIHEAMAAGAIVVTWDAACIKGLYGDNVITVPTLHSPGYDPQTPYASNRRLTSDEAVDALFQEIKKLESDPVAKEALRSKAMQWAQDPSRSWISQIALFNTAISEDKDKLTAQS